MPRGQDDDGQGWPDLPELGQHVQPIAARQEQIEEDQVHPEAQRFLQSLLAVARLGHLIAGGAQGVGYAAANGCLVLDDNDAGFGVMG